MRKLKKLTLKKEVISNLNENEMNVLKGGVSMLYTNCKNLSIIGCPQKNETYYCDYENLRIKTNVNDCNNSSQVGSGCASITCGWAYTCNG